MAWTNMVQDGSSFWFLCVAPLSSLFPLKTGEDLPGVSASAEIRTGHHPTHVRSINRLNQLHTVSSVMTRVYWLQRE